MVLYQAYARCMHCFTGATSRERMLGLKCTTLAHSKLNQITPGIHDEGLPESQQSPGYLANGKKRC